jgi:hypothetical protein
MAARRARSALPALLLAAGLLLWPDAARAQAPAEPAPRPTEPPRLLPRAPYPPAGPAQPSPAPPPGEPTQPPPAPVPPTAAPAPAPAPVQPGPAEVAPRGPAEPGPAEAAPKAPGTGPAEAAEPPEPPVPGGQLSPERRNILGTRRWSFGAEARYRFLVGDTTRISGQHGYGFAAAISNRLIPWVGVEFLFSFDRFQRFETVNITDVAGNPTTVQDTQKLDHTSFFLSLLLEPPVTWRVRPQLYAGAGPVIVHYQSPQPVTPNDISAVAGGIRLGAGVVGQITGRIEAYLRFEMHLLFSTAQLFNSVDVISSSGGLSGGFGYRF